MRALLQGSNDDVGRILKEDAEAARQPFFDHNFELPLCYAVRAGCDTEVIRMLLKFQADINAIDVHARTPLQILCAKTPPSQLPILGTTMLNSNNITHLLLKSKNNMQQDTIGVPSLPWLDVLSRRPLVMKERADDASIIKTAICMLASGADPNLLDNKGDTALGLALGEGRAHLARLLQCYHGVQAYFVLFKALDQPYKAPQDEQDHSPITKLSRRAIFVICSFLIPERDSPILGRVRSGTFSNSRQ